MLDNVAFERMPKDEMLTEDDRRGFVETFIPALWSDDEVTAARAYFLDRSAAFPSCRPELMLDLVKDRVGAAGGPWRMLESFDDPAHEQLTPGVVTISAVATLEACKAKYKLPAEIAQCLEANVAPLDFMIGKP